jgi:hypothetical protein
MAVGNKENAALNGEWGKHVCPALKRLTAKRRRRAGRKVVSEARGEVYKDAAQSGR